jgi:hypothetical protein
VPEARDSLVSSERILLLDPAQTRNLALTCALRLRSLPNRITDYRCARAGRVSRRDDGNLNTRLENRCLRSGIAERLPFSQTRQVSRKCGTHFVFRVVQGFKAGVYQCQKAYSGDVPFFTIPQNWKFNYTRI